ncbi:adenosylcobalamin-dependent ribonucleoside-diphosphate reductase, partial [bacterium]|nr:adenosylcobalamin-dependent ribonucleoside-diphosphate reductase [bacterium]
MVALGYNGEYRDVQTLRMSDYIGLETLLDDETPVLVSTHNRYEIRDRHLVKSLRDADGAQITKTFGMGRIPLPILNDLVLDDELCVLFGRWLGDGCVTHRTGTDVPAGIKIVFNLNERAEAEQMARIIEAKFGIPASLKLSSTKRWLDLWVNSMPLGEFFKALFGAYSYGKSIPQMLMTLPDTLTLALLKGLFGADSYTSGNYLGILLSNKTLSIQVHQLLLRLGYVFSIKENTHRLAKHPSYRITATVAECADLFKTLFERDAPPATHKTNYHLEYDDLNWVRIDRIEAEMYRGLVMDIEVEEDHSFVTAGVIISNCYVIPSPRDSREGIMETLTYMTEIMSRGGGVGINISTLRPRHAYVRGVNGRSSGSVSWGGLYSFVTGLIEQGGSRRGALMLILNDWHPDIFNFINSKRQAGQITNANISVGVSDKLMAAIRADEDWTLMFPDTSDPTYNAEWDGDLDKWQAAGKKAIPYKTVKAKEIWDAIIESAWASAEPGLWFRERSNKMSNGYYYSNIIATNPCGEEPLPAWAVCNLGAINLSRFYNTETQDVDWKMLDQSVRYATRFLDNIIDSTPYFFEQNRDVQLGERRIGLGTMGIAELMIQCRVRYGSDESVAFIDKVYKAIARAAYETSAQLAVEKGAFPQFDADQFIESGFMQAMPDEIRQLVKECGIRNVTLLTQAPTGTTGTLVNTSTGIEPFFSWVYYRKSRLGLHEEKMPIAQDWFNAHPGETQLPDYFVTAMELAPEDHVKVQGAFQRWVDAAISKTCNVPNNYTVSQVGKLYEMMYDLGCKGGTIYRDGSRTEQVLMLKGDERAESEMSDLKKKEADPSAAEDKTEAPATPHRVYSRPTVLQGTTVSFKTPFGTSYITMNSDEHGCPFEVFITAPGKAGSDLQADAEGLGRMISLSLRTTEPHNRLTMIRLIIEQLRDIGGA